MNKWVENCSFPYENVQSRVGSGSGAMWSWVVGCLGYLTIPGLSDARVALGAQSPFQRPGSRGGNIDLFQAGL